ncbi:MAG: Ig-like domain repeat protein, partial [Gammaproteobacteria bacterium]|nr:Ig-like domain repeat protein [Gammaproteobacteria bacterium]
MKIVIDSLDNVRVSGFDLHVTDEHGQVKVVKDALISLAKGELTVQSNGESITMAQLIESAKVNMASLESVFIEDMLTAGNSTGLDDGEELKDKLAELQKSDAIRTEELDKLLEQLKNLEKKLDEKEEKLEIQKEELKAKIADDADKSEVDGSHTVEDYIEEIQDPQVTDVVEEQILEVEEAQHQKRTNNEPQKIAENQNSSSQTSSKKSDEKAEVTVDQNTVTLVLDSDDDSGVLGDFITNINNDLTIKGETKPLSEVKIVIAGNVYKTIAEANGSYSLDIPTLNDGSYSIVVEATSPGGGVATLTKTIVVDTVPPTAPTVSLAADSDSGESQTDAITANKEPVFEGMAEANASVAFVIDGREFITRADGDGKWSITVEGRLPDGLIEYKVTATDVAGNVSDATIQTVTIDSQIILTGGLDASTDAGYSQTDEITNISTLMFSGTGEPGVKVLLHFNDLPTALEVEVDESGNWSIDGNLPRYSVLKTLSEGEYSYKISSVDLAGNAKEIEGKVVVDLTKPESTLWRLDADSDTGQYDDDAITQNAEPTLSGVSEPNVFITVIFKGKDFLDGKSVDVEYRTTADENGVWQLKVTDTLADGSHNYVVKATDFAGNIEENIGSFVVDRVNSLRGGLDEKSDSGISDKDNVTKINAPTFSGIGDVGEQVTLFINDKEYTQNIDSSGHWSIDIPEEDALNDALYAYRLFSVDTAGNEVSVKGEITVDTTTFVNGSLASSSDSGDFNDDNYTNVNTPTFSGQGEAGSSIVLKIDQLVLTTKVDDEGNWTVPILSEDALQDGDYDFTITATDIAGNTASESGKLTIDTVAPTPFSGGLQEISTNDTGEFDNDGITSNTLPVFTGLGEPSAKVELFIAGESYQATVGSDGRWIIEVLTRIDDGAWSYVLTSEDLAGNQVSITDEMTIDTVAELTGGLDANSDSGISREDNITNVVSPAFSGTSEPGAVVSFSIRGDQYQTEVNSAGNWRISLPTASPLQDGTHEYEIRVVDVAGNEKVINDSIIVDTTIPEFFDGGLDSDSDSGRLSDDGVTNESTPIFSGKVEVGSSVVIIISGKTYNAVVDVKGNWSVKVEESLNDGDYPYTLTATDVAGNSRDLEGKVIIDTENEVSGSLEAGSDTGRSSADGITQTKSPTFTGKGEANAEVTFVINNVEYKTEIEANGTWSLNISDILSDGTYEYTLKSIDLAGNEAIEQGRIIVDNTTNITARLSVSSDTGDSDSDSYTNDISPAFNGVAEAGAEITLIIGGNEYSTVALDDDTWSIDVTKNLSEGTIEYTVRTVDIAGNMNSTNGSIVIDTTAPLLSGGIAPTSDSGEFNDDGITKISTPDFSGTGEYGDSITLLINNQEYHTEVDVNGQWTIKITNALGEGSSDYVVTAVDLAGNKAILNGTVIIDNSISLTGGLDAASDSGRSNSDSNTNVTTPTFSGSGEPKAAITLMINNAEYTTTVDSSGQWTVDVAEPLVDSIYTYTISTIDLAGNEASLDGSIVVDLVAPGIFTGELARDSDTGLSDNDGITNHQLPLFNGHVEVGSDVSLKINGNYYQAQVNDAGEWTAEVAHALADGNYEYELVATDAAGNTTELVENITVDTQILTLSGGLDIDSDTGKSFDNITNIPLPNFSGKAEVGAQVILKINGNTYNTKADAEGNWSVKVENELPDNTHSYTLLTIDIAGNKKELAGEISVDTETFVFGGLLAASDSGLLSSDGYTNHTKPIFEGTGEAGANISLVINGASYQTTVDASGKWIVKIDHPLSDGSFSYVITATDIAGNVATSEGAITIDTQDPIGFTGGLDSGSDSGIDNNDNITNSVSPLFSGEGEPGNVVTLKIGNKEYTSTVVDDGSWNIPITTVLGQGESKYELILTDKAGNTSELDGSIIIDTVAEQVTGSLSTLSDSGVKGDEITNDTRPFFNGTAEPDSMVELIIGDSQYSVKTDDNGNWTLQVTNELVDGKQNYTLISTDLAGNISNASGSINIDTTTPNPFTVGIDEVSDSGISSSDNITNITSPIVAGLGENDSIVTVVIAEKKYETTVSNGSWQIKVDDLSDGEHTIEAYSIDVAGNKTNTIIVKLTIDTTTTVTGKLDASSDTGLDLTDGLTKDDKPVFTGTAEVGATVVLSIAGQTISAVVDSLGNWSATIPVYLGEGEHVYTIKSTDIAGNTDEISGAITVDLTAPNHFSASLDKDSDSANNSDNITNINRPTFNGIGEDGARVTLNLAGQQHTTTVVDGHWAIEVGQIGDGTHEYLAVQTDLAGNVSDVIKGVITIDTEVFVTGGLDAASDTGFENDDDITSIANPVFSGTGEPEAVVKVTINNHVYESVVGDDGNWSITIEDALLGNTLDNPSYAYNIEITDIAGNVAMLDGDIIVDLTAPTPFTYQLDANSDSGVAGDAITNVSRPIFSGIGEPGIRVTLTIDGKNYTETVNSDGTWSVQPTSDLISQGVYNYEVVAMDKAGNTVEKSGNLTFDNNATLSGGLDQSSDSGRRQDDNITNDNTPLFSGNAEVGSEVKLTINGNDYTAIAGSNGRWEITIDDVIADTDSSGISYTINAIDIAGNNATTVTGVLYVDTTAPTIFTGSLDASTNSASDSDNITNHQTPTFSGLVEEGSTVEVLINNKKYHAQVNEDGKWSFTMPDTDLLPDGTHSYTFTATDVAGNTKLISDSVDIDTFVSLLKGGLSAESDSGEVNNDGITNVTSPTFNGSTEVGAKVILTINNIDYEADVDADGNWSVEVSDTLAENVYSYKLTATDVAGNQLEKTGSFEIDLTPPETFTATLDLSSDSGTIGNSRTNDTTPMISGTGSEGDKIKVIIGSQLFTTTVVDGAWSITSAELGQGTHKFEAVATDIVGNSTAPIISEFVIDTETFITAGLVADSDHGKFNDDGVTNETDPTFSGTTEVGNVVKFHIDGQVIIAVVDVDGNWTATVTTALSEGEQQYRVEAEDTAGNTAEQSGTITIDTTAPALFSVQLGDDSDSELLDGITKEKELTFIGQGENGAEIIFIIDGQRKVTTVQDGQWAITTEQLSDGQHTYSVTQIDLAGNETEALSGTVVVDTNTTLTGGLDTISDSGLNNDDGVTRYSKPIFSGSAEKGSEVVLTINGHQYITVVDSVGNWKIVVTDTLPDNSEINPEYHYTIVSQDIAGNTAEVNGQITVDTAAPISFSYQLDSDSDSGKYQDDAITNILQPTFSGTVEAGVQVILTIDYQNYVATVGADGQWTVKVTKDLPLNGEHNYTITAIDLAGNETKGTGSLRTDSVSELTGRLSRESDTGSDNDDNITNEVNPMFSGYAEEGSDVTLTINGLSYESTANASGYWEINVTDALPETNVPGLEYSITATDIAGNLATPVSGYVIVDLTAPAIFVGGLDDETNSSDKIDQITNVTVPKFSGIVDPGASVTLSINNQSYEAIVNEKGEWHVTIASSVPLSDGTHSYKLVAEDIAGNKSYINSEIIVDTQSPIDFNGRLAASSDTGHDDSDQLTNDTTPFFEGNVEPNSSVVLFIGGKEYIAQVESNGQWRVQVTDVLNDTDTPHSYEIIATDIAGNSGILAGTITIDTVLPDFTGGLDAASDSGTKGDNFTNVDKPTFSGTGENDVAVALTINGKVYTTTVVNNQWSIEVVQGLVDADYPYTLIGTDLAGNQVALSDTIVIDSTASLTGGLDASSDTGDKQDDNITYIKQPIFSGTSDPLSTITLKINGTEYEFQSGIDGSWAFEVPQSLIDGDYDYEITAIDAVGNVATDSLDNINVITGTVQIDSHTQVTARLATASDTGHYNDDQITNETMPTFSGTAEAGAKIALVIAEVRYETVALTNGSWSITVGTELADGQQNYQVTSTDIAGNEATANGFIIIDTTTPTNVTGGLDSASDTGLSSTDNITNEMNPSFSGTGEPDVLVYLTIGGQTYEGTVDSAGKWKILVTASLNGNHEYSIYSQDLAGNTSNTVTGEIKVDLDTSVTARLSSDSDSNINDDGYTNDDTPQFSGTGEPGSKIELTLGSTHSVHTTVDQHGQWTLQLPLPALTDNTHTLNVKATDIAGNEATTTVVFVVDTQAPIGFSGGLANESDSGSVGDGLTNDNTPAFSGVGEAGTEVKLVIGSSEYITVVKSDGTWTLNVTNALNDGSYDYTLSSKDLAGNYSYADGNLVVDTHVAITGGLSVQSDTGLADDDDITNDNTPWFNGSGDIGGTVTLFINNKEYQTVVGNDGQWKVEVTGTLPEGTVPYVIKIVDLADNASETAGSIVIDTTTPPLTAMLSDATNSGLTSDTITNYTQPTFNGTGENGNKIEFKIGDKTYHTTVVSGSWSLEVGTALSAGIYTYDVKATDVAGNSESLSGTIVIDVSTELTGGLKMSSNSGDISDTITNDSTPTFSGTGEVGATIELVIDGNSVTSVVDQSGNWQLTVANVLGQGEYTYQLTATDIAGNTATLAQSVTIDTETSVSARLDVTSDTGKLNDDGVTYDNTPTFSGLGEVGAQIVLVINKDSGLTYQTTVQQDGTWEIESINMLADAHYTYKVTSTDVAGNEDETTGTFTIDTVLPDFTGGLDAASDSGTKGDNFTNVDKPTFSGTG